MSRTWMFLVAGCGLLISTAQSQTPKPKLTARELFYAAADAPPQATPAIVKSEGKSAKPAPAPKSRRKSQPPVSNGDVPAAAAPDSTPVVNASYASANAGPALGLRYSILKRQADGQNAELDADSTFHAGDRAGGPQHYVEIQAFSVTGRPLLLQRNQAHRRRPP
ncbi:MAG: hypothetical protein HYX25_08705 [Candidatus Solibacter usitatus]|nr:hypothetical protein [Candidatus Solibacter usitatus]